MIFTFFDQIVYSMLILIYFSYIFFFKSKYHDKNIVLSFFLRKNFSFRKCFLIDCSWKIGICTTKCIYWFIKKNKKWNTNIYLFIYFLLNRTDIYCCLCLNLTIHIFHYLQFFFCFMLFPFITLFFLIFKKGFCKGLCYYQRKYQSGFTIYFNWCCILFYFPPWYRFIWASPWITSIIFWRGI